jgi:HAD superfamily hydrolase (TIGR01662 family)
VSVRAVFFDVGETLVDESGYWARVARLVGLRPHVLMAGLGATIARAEEHHSVWDYLGLERPAAAADVTFGRDELYPDARPCLARLRADGYRVGVVGNHTEAIERWLRGEDLPVDVVGSSASWGVRKPDPGFFARIVDTAGLEPDEIAYVGDRVDNDVAPALAAGLVAVHVRRGPWGWLQPGREQATLCVDSLAELPEALRGL